MLAMGVERVENSGSTPRPINLKFTSRLPYLLEEVQTPSVEKLGTIVMSRSSRPRIASAASSDVRENGEHHISRQQACNKFLEYRNSPKMVPRQPEQHVSRDYVKRRTLSDSSAIRGDESPFQRSAVRSLTGNPYKTLRTKDKASRKVSFSEDLVIIGDRGDVKTKSAHPRHTRHESLGDADDRRIHKPRYAHLLKDKEDSSSAEDMDGVYHGLTRLLGSKSKKAEEGQSSQHKVQSEKSSKPKLTKGLSIPGKKVKKKVPHAPGSI